MDAGEREPERQRFLTRIEETMLQGNPFRQRLMKTLRAEASIDVLYELEFWAKHERMEAVKEAWTKVGGRIKRLLEEEEG